MHMSVGPGRFKTYRGHSGYEVPPELNYPACSGCGAEWLTSTQIDTLSDAFEKMRADRGH